MKTEKKTMSGLAAKAVARVKGNPAFPGSWGVGEHLACMRFLACDALAQASADVAKDPKLKVGEQFNSLLKAAFASDPELAYASNFQKLLVKAGELKDLAPSYE